MNQSDNKQTFDINNILHQFVDVNVFVKYVILQSIYIIDNHLKSHDICSNMKKYSHKANYRFKETRSFKDEN